MDAAFTFACEKLVERLENDPDTFAMETFLRSHDILLRHAFGVVDPKALRWSPHLAVMVPDVCLPSAASRWAVVLLDTPQYPLFLSRNKPVSSVANSVDELQTLHQWIVQNPVEAASALPGLDLTFEGVVFAGHRDRLTPQELEYLRTFNASMDRVSIRTYQWLIDRSH